MNKNKKNDDPTPLSLEETKALLGAEEEEEIGNFRLDPMGMQVLASRVARRLASKRGRPTDNSWDIVRKIPMSGNTWSALGEIAGEVSAVKVNVATGQMAAIALELGLKELREKPEGTTSNITKLPIGFTFRIHEESLEEARQLCPVIGDQGIW